MKKPELQLRGKEIKELITIIVSAQIERRHFNQVWDLLSDKVYKICPVLPLKDTILKKKSYVSNALFKMPFYLRGYGMLIKY